MGNAHYCTAIGYFSLWSFQLDSHLLFYECLLFLTPVLEIYLHIYKHSLMICHLSIQIKLTLTAIRLFCPKEPLGIPNFDTRSQILFVWQCVASHQDIVESLYILTKVFIWLFASCRWRTIVCLFVVLKLQVDEGGYKCLCLYGLHGHLVVNT